MRACLPACLPQRAWMHRWRSEPSPLNVLASARRTSTGEKEGLQGDSGDSQRSDSWVCGAAMPRSQRWTRWRE